MMDMFPVFQNRKNKYVYLTFFVLIVKCVPCLRAHANIRHVYSLHSRLLIGKRM